MDDVNGRGLWRRLWWIVAVAWIVAAVRLGLDFRQQDDPVVVLLGMPWRVALGVYYTIPVLLLIGALKGAFAGLGWPKLMLAVALLAVLCWFVPNSIAYTTGQLQGWTHGRFSQAPLATGTAAKIGTGLKVAALTTVAGFAWTFVWMHLIVYLPRRLRRRR